MKEEEHSKDLASLIGLPEDEISPREIVIDQNQDDFDYAKNVIKMTLEKMNIALDDLLDLATRSGHPHAYEIASMISKNQIEGARQLLETKRVDQHVKGIDAKLGKPDVLNQNVFVGSTAELAKMLDIKRKQDE